ncbi:MAG: DUF547 domain-containing protein [Methyloligellaceae bacterium]
MNTAPIKIPSRTLNKFITSLVLIMTLAACSNVEIPEREWKETDDPLKYWAEVLDKHVDVQGRIDFSGLAAAPENLLVFLNYVKQTSPHTHPADFTSSHAAIAYYINAYNALAMYNIILLGFPEALRGWRKLDYFLLKRFNIGGQRNSLYGFENRIIRKLGEERVHFALNCMSVGCPRLPAVPFTPENLEKQLDQQARRFFGEDRYLQVDRSRKTVRVSEILDFFTEDFTIRSGTLINYINRYREERIPGSYRVEFLDYDWTVNRQPIKTGQALKAR